MEQPVSPSPQEKTLNPNSLKQPILALVCELIPALLFLTGDISFVLFGLLFAPIIGLSLATTYLGRGKANTCRTGRLLAIIAVALPVCAVAFVIIFFIGAVTGVISLM